MLFAGTQDGTVLAWKFNSAANTFERASSLAEHTLPVVSLVSGASRLYFASMDHTIRVVSYGGKGSMHTFDGIALTFKPWHFSPCTSDQGWNDALQGFSKF